MSRSLPEYTQIQINQALAFALLVGFDSLNRSSKEMIENIAHDAYVLKLEEE